MLALWLLLAVAVGFVAGCVCQRREDRRRERRIARRMQAQIMQRVNRYFQAPPLLVLPDDGEPFARGRA